MQVCVCVCVCVCLCVFVCVHERIRLDKIDILIDLGGIYVSFVGLFFKRDPYFYVFVQTKSTYVPKQNAHNQNVHGQKCIWKNAPEQMHMNKNAHDQMP